MPVIHPVDIEAAKQLVILRKKMKHTQQDLATKLGISYQQIQKYEAGRDKMGFSRVYDICVALGVHILEFLPPMPLAQEHVRLVRPSHTQSDPGHQSNLPAQREGQYDTAFGGTVY